MPAARPLLETIPKPHPLLEVIGNDLALFTLAHRQTAPAGRRLGCGPGRHRQRRGLRLQAAGRLAIGRLTGGHDGRRIAEVDRLIGMHLRQESFPFPLQGAQQPRQMAVAGVEHNMGKTQSLPPQAMDQGHRHLALGTKFPLLRNPCLPATVRIGKPRLGNEQFALDQSGNAVSGHGSEDADLAVVGLAQPPVPLAGDPRRHVALLGEGALVDHQGARVAELYIGVGNQLPAYAAAIPCRFTQHVVEPLVLATRHGFGHLLQVAPLALEQAVQILAGRVLDRANPALEAT